MLLKWILFVLSICTLEFMAARSPSSYSYANCPYPRLENGRVRLRQRAKMVRFMCLPGFELVGNKYAICRDDNWDVPLPVCVRPGCALEEVQNGIVLQSRAGAWLLYLCLPGHKLIGSSALYCDGRKWNASTPVCVDSSAPPKLSCDFEDPNLCGWTQDELHDFDWKRLNKGTPSSVLLTGPSFDHTFGIGGSGHYMYIESTGRRKNDTARLFSPVFDVQLSKDGCFSFYYHMYGKTTGGLKVYQKPDKLVPGEDRRGSVLFEKWGNQGDEWFNAVVPLKDYNDDFQIVIEGIRGMSFTSDIAVDDVSILQGDNCTVTTVPTTTVREMDSCAGRCHTASVGDIGCACVVDCVVKGTCCGDFFDYCLFAPDENSSSDDMSTTPEELSHQNTQKLVNSSSPEPSISTSTTEATTMKTTTKPTTTTPKPTTKATTLSKTAKPTTKIVVTTKKLPQLIFKTTTVIYNATGILKKDNKTVNVKPKDKPTITTTKTTPKVVVATTQIAKKVKNNTIIDIYRDMAAKEDEVRRIQNENISSVKTISPRMGPSEASSSGSLRIILIILCTVAMCAGAGYAVKTWRGARGRELLARLRGTVSNHQEVRYLTTSEDDE